MPVRQIGGNREHLAVGTGGRLDIPAGVYSVNTLEARIGFYYLWIRGAGVWRTILKSRSGGDVIAKKPGVYSWHILIENLSIAGDRSLGTGHGISFPPRPQGDTTSPNDTGLVTIRNVHIRNCGGSGQCSGRRNTWGS